MYKLSASLCCAFGAIAAFAQSAVEHSAAVAPGVEIAIDNAKGRTEIVGWDENRVEVTGTLGAEVMAFEFVPTETAVRIAVVNPKRLRNVGETVLTVKAPRGAALNVEAVSANVRAAGMTGNLDLESVSGAIAVEDGGAYLRAETVSGDITVNGAFGGVNLETVSGAVSAEGSADRVSAESVSGNLTLAAMAQRVKAETVSGAVALSNLGGDLRAESVSGKIFVDGGAFDECKLSSCSGAVEWKGRLSGRGELKANSHSGTVRIDFTETPNATYTINTFSGGVTLDLPDTASPGGKSVTFTRGAGEGEVRVETFSGAINLAGK